MPPQEATMSTRETVWRLGRRILIDALVLGIVAVAGLWLVLRNGVSARDTPTWVEAMLARNLRHLATPRSAREAKNPHPATPERLATARAHFADHCASCHGNDGRGQTAMGRALYPKAPDMTGPGTQALSDGELFYVIENGVRLTGMPAWGETGKHDDEQSWTLVHFIRHLPALGAAEMEEMKAMNPASPAEVREEMEKEHFLEGDESAEPSTTPAEHAHAHGS